MHLTKQKILVVGNVVVGGVKWENRSKKQLYGHWGSTLIFFGVLIFLGVV